MRIPANAYPQDYFVALSTDAARPEIREANTRLAALPGSPEFLRTLSVTPYDAAGNRLQPNSACVVTLPYADADGDGLPPGCNFDDEAPTATGAGTGCLSTTGVENMVGSLWEMVAEWISDGLGGALVTQRGGGFSTGPGATTMLMESEDNPLYSDAGMGFRCAMQLR